MKTFEETVMRKIWWRIVPLMAGGLLLNLLDRTNIAFAALQMNKALHISNTQFGLAAGCLAVGVLIFGIPSTLLLRRLGARRWISLTLIAWGIFSAATAFVTDIRELTGVRLLLGMAEAGYIPGAILYFSYWFPAEYRGRVISSFIFMQPAGLIVGGPVSGLLLSHGLFGLAGWQSMFIFEAVPTVFLAWAVFNYLVDRPDQAGWLSFEEKKWLEERLELEGQAVAGGRKGERLQQVRVNGRLWSLAIVYFGVGTSGAGAIYFLPLMIRSMNVSLLQTGLLAAVPAAAAALLLPFWGAWADRAGRRESVAAVAACALALGLLTTAELLPSLWAVASLTAALIGFFGLMPAFWALPSTFLTGSAAAAGIAFISTVGNLGNLSGPYLIGRMSDLSGSYKLGLASLAAAAAVAAMILFVEAESRRTPGSAPSLS